jgi:hypothetical protein
MEDLLKQLEVESDQASRERWQRELEKLRAPGKSTGADRSSN